MGKYINTGNDGFTKARNDEYVDKSELIGYVNRVLNTEHNLLCLTRPRRFGKSMAAKMLCAYYDQSCNSRELFEDLKIAKNISFEKHLNKYPVIYLDITYFTTTCRQTEDVVRNIERDLIDDIQQTYPSIEIAKDKPLIDVLFGVVEHTKQKFIMIVDEWDAICREADNKQEVMKKYVDWLRSLYKTPMTDRVFAGVYMTGILPIIQYDTQSALNNFDELTMVSPGMLGEYFGFTEREVKVLCRKHKLNREEIKQWYDGYQLGQTKGIYNPYSVMSAIRKGSVENYWTTTGAYESLKKYIELNFDGLKDAVLRLMAGEKVGVNVLRFTNDLHKIQSKDDALATLVHLGYLSYDNKLCTCVIPNYEVKQEFAKSVRDTSWQVIVEALDRSEKLMEDTLAGNGDAVARAIDIMHMENTSLLQYNDENALACALTLAYYSAQRDYKVLRELPTGKGFADIVLLPHRWVDKPAIVLELKWNKSANTAIKQIHKRKYVHALEGYVGEILLIGVNYDKKTKIHECMIERIQKNDPLKMKNDPLKSIDEPLKMKNEPLRMKNDPLKMKNAPLKNAKITARRKQIETLVQKNIRISKEVLSEQLGLSVSTIKREMKTLGYEWVGHSANGYWKKRSESK